MAKRLGIGLLGGLMALALGAPAAWGQSMDFGAEPVEDTGDDGAEMDFGAEDGGEDDGAAMDFGAEPAEGEGDEGGEEEDSLFGDIAGETETSSEDDLASGDEEQVDLPPPEVWAVQRVYALRNRRFELVPRFGFSMNDQFVNHWSFGGELNWYITDVLAIGIEGMWFYGNFETDINYYTSRSFRVSIPINEYWMGWYLNFSYVPIYGKFAIFNRWIVHWDAFLTGGLGITMTRPIPVVDAEFRDFSETSDYNVNITFSIGLGGRIFLRRWLAFFAEFRLYGFPQPLENREVALLSDDCNSAESCGSTWPYQRSNPDTWLDEDGEFAVNVMVQLGLSIFLPPTFDYQLPL